MKIFCFVILNPDVSMSRWTESSYVGEEYYYDSHPYPETAIQETWSKRCSKVIFFDSQTRMRKVTTIKITSQKSESWAALREALMHISSQYLDSYDWFLKAEDDTFVIMENLAYYLSVHNATESTYFGHAYEYWGTTFNAAGPGIVLSQAALRRLNSKLAKGHCGSSSMAGDGLLGRCLSEIGIVPEDTRDHMARARFLMHQPSMHLLHGKLPILKSFWMQTKYISGDVSFQLMCFYSLVVFPLK